MSAIRQPGKAKMPRWIWREPNQTIISAIRDPGKGLPLEVKRFVKFIWKFGPQGSDWWNCVLARYFKVTPRTIRRWLQIAKAYPLIAIAYPDGRGRVIRRLPYFTRAVFAQQRELWLAHLPRTHMSALDNAQQKNNYLRNSSSSAGVKQADAALPPADASEKTSESTKSTSSGGEPGWFSGKADEQAMTDNPDGQPPKQFQHPAHQETKSLATRPMTPAKFAEFCEIELWPGDAHYMVNHRERFVHFTDGGCDDQEALILLLAEHELEQLQRRKETK